MDIPLQWCLLRAKLFRLQNALKSLQISKDSSLCRFFYSAPVCELNAIICGCELAFLLKKKKRNSQRLKPATMGLSNKRFGGVGGALVNFHRGRVLACLQI